MSPAAPGFASCAALVLAGGRGERFGGDKPLAPFRGTTLLWHLLARLGELGFPQRMVAAKEPARLRNAVEMIGMPMIGSPIDWAADATDSYNPLAGLAAGFRAARAEWLFACAVDMPFAAERALLEAMFALAPGAAAVVPMHRGAPEPLCALWNCASARAPADELLRSGRGGPRALLDRLQARRLDWPDPRPFLDADTREALGKLETGES